MASRHWRARRRRGLFMFLAHVFVARAARWRADARREPQSRRLVIWAAGPAPFEARVKVVLWRPTSGTASTGPRQLGRACTCTCRRVARERASGLVPTLFGPVCAPAAHKCARCASATCRLVPVAGVRTQPNASRTAPSGVRAHIRLLSHGSRLTALGSVGATCAQV